MIIWFGWRVVDKGKVGWVGVANKNAWFGARCMFVVGFANSIFWERTSIVCSTGPTLTGVKLAGLFIIPIQGALGNDTIGGGQAKCWKEKEKIFFPWHKYKMYMKQIFLYEYKRYCWL